MIQGKMNEDYALSHITCQSGGATLRGVLTRRGGQGKQPLVLLFHGFGADKNEQANMFGDLAAALAVQGIASLRFDFMGSGESEGDSTDMNVLTELADAEAILAYAQTLDFVDRSRIGALGMSMGGVVCSLLAGRHEAALRAVCLWAPAACLVDDAKAGRVRDLQLDPENIPEVIRFADGFAVGRQFLQVSAGLDIYGTASAYKGPVLVAQGDADPVVDMAYARRYVDGYKNAELLVIEGAGHGFFGGERERLNEATCDFFKANLL